MSEIYLVGGTTPRTDLDNYVSANISKDNAISSMNKWKEYQGDYEDFHIDSIEINDLEQHDKEVYNKAIDDCKEICNKNWLNGTVAYRIIEELCEQMEQLKGGGKNDD